MILVEKQREEQFKKLLEDTADITVSRIGSSVTDFSGVQFEDLTYDNMLLVSKGTSYEGKVEHTGSLSFPDIVIPEYKQGVEVKVTQGNKWQSLGNSVVESTRVAEIKRIYMYFGRFGKEHFEIKFRPYEECLVDILVTHSPRYKIDMDLDKGHSIFDKMGIDYETFRASDPISHAKAYYKGLLKPGEDIWWIDSSNDVEGQDFVIRNYTSLSSENKNSFMLEVFALFPEVFSDTNPNKYTRIGAYLLQKYGVLSSSLRDIFSAGGQVTINQNGVDQTHPQIIGKFIQHKESFFSLLETIPIEVVSNYWDTPLNDSPTISMWLEELEKKAGKEKRFTLERLLG